MGVLWVMVFVLSLGGCATMRASDPVASILVDLDPASVDRSVIVESITADKEGRLYVPDRVTGNILRVDPKSPPCVTPLGVKIGGGAGLRPRVRNAYFEQRLSP